MAVPLQKQKGIDSSMNGALPLSRRREWPRAVGMNRLISNGRWKKAVNLRRTGDLSFATSSLRPLPLITDGRHPTGDISLPASICLQCKKKVLESSSFAWTRQDQSGAQNSNSLPEKLP